MIALSWTKHGATYETFHVILGHYGFIGVPLAVAVAVIRFELFSIKHTNRSHSYFMSAIIVALVGYFILLGLIRSISVHIGQFFAGDLIVMLITIPVYYVVRPVYGKTRHWIKQQIYGNVDDFKVGLRIFSHELIKVNSRRDLETLVSWGIVSDFRLKSAELVFTTRPTIPYAISLPLTVSNVFLGTLFLGAKINGTNFTGDEMAYLTELQKQLSLALWSI